jgi:O-antigen ligase
MATVTAHTASHHLVDRATGTVLFWQIYDVALAAMVVLVSTDTFNRFGVGSPAWAICYAMAAARMLSAPAFMGALIRSNLTQLAYPVACIVSVLWSKTPQWSFFSGLQLLATVVIALVIGARVRLFTLIFILFGVLLLPLGMSLVNWQTGIFGQIYGGSGGLLGIYTQKNMLGENAMLVLLAGVALILAGAWRSLFLLAVIAGGMLMAALSLQLSQSVSPLLVLPVSVALLLVLCRRHLGPKLVVIPAIGAFLALALGPVILAVMGVDPVAEILGAVGKSSTLTGRTKIWEIALQVLPDYWGLGVGFLAFWRAPEFASYAAMAQAIGGENVRAFHNFIFEIWIGTGIPGLATMLVLLWAALWRTWNAYRASGSVSAAFAFVMIVTAIILSLPGTGLYRGHESTIVFVVMFGAAAMASTRPGWPLKSSKRGRSAPAD